MEMGELMTAVISNGNASSVARPVYDVFFVWLP